MDFTFVQCVETKMKNRKVIKTNSIDSQNKFDTSTMLNRTY